jgi:hypothetical protein
MSWFILSAVGWVWLADLLQVARSHRAPAGSVYGSPVSRYLLLMAAFAAYAGMTTS